MFVFLNAWILLYLSLNAGSQREVVLPLCIIVFNHVLLRYYRKPSNNANSCLNNLDTAKYIAY